MHVTITLAVGGAIRAGRHPGRPMQHKNVGSSHWLQPWRQLILIQGRSASRHAHGDQGSSSELRTSRGLLITSAPFHVPNLQLHPTQSFKYWSVGQPDAASRQTQYKGSSTGYATGPKPTTLAPAAAGSPQNSPWNEIGKGCNDCHCQRLCRTAHGAVSTTSHDPRLYVPAAACTCELQHTATTACTECLPPSKPEPGPRLLHS
jgi:hypothetical protein